MVLCFNMGPCSRGWKMKHFTKLNTFSAKLTTLVQPFCVLPDIMRYTFLFCLVTGTEVAKAFYNRDYGLEEGLNIRL